MSIFMIIFHSIAFVQGFAIVALCIYSVFIERQKKLIVTKKQKVKGDHKMFLRFKYATGVLILTVIMLVGVTSYAFADHEGGGSGVGGGGDSKASKIMGIAVRAVDAMSMICKAKKADPLTCQSNATLTKLLPIVKVVLVDETKTEDGTPTEASNNGKDTIWIAKDNWNFIVNSTSGSNRKLTLLIHELYGIAEIETSETYAKSNLYISTLDENFINIHKLVTGSTKLSFSVRKEVNETHSFFLEKLTFEDKGGWDNIGTIVPKECRSLTTMFRGKGNPTGMYQAGNNKLVACITDLYDKITDSEYETYSNPDHLKDVEKKYCNNVFKCKFSISLKKPDVTVDTNPGASWWGSMVYERDFVYKVTGFKDEVFAEEE